MSPSPLRVGIVGANAERGWSKDAHLKALAALPDFELVAVSARTQAIADEAAKAYGAKAAFGDSLAMVRDPGVDVVAVTVKVPEHRAVVLAALAAGKHVYCEWPLGRDIAEAEEMTEAAARSGAVAMIGLQGLSAAAARRAHELVSSGALGELLNMRVTSPTGGWGAETPAFYAYLQDKTTGATLASVQGGHTLATMEALAGAFTEVDARVSTLRKTVRISGTDETIARTSPDHIVVTGRHASGCVSVLELFGGARGIPFRLELVGTKGSLVISGDFPGGFQAGDMTLTATVPFDPPTPVVAGLSGPPANVAEAYARLGGAIRAGGQVEPGFGAAVRLTRLLDVVQAASDEGRRQTPGA